MKIDVFAVNHGCPRELTAAFGEWIGQDRSAPDFVALHQSVPTRPNLPSSAVPQATALHGATTCLGVMSDDGPSVNAGLGAFAIWDPSGSYGTAARALGQDPRRAARDAAEAALIAADREGEAPDLVWLSAAPGAEEEVLKGIEDIVGPKVPIIGGSAADDTVQGDWSVFDAAGEHANGVVVSALFPSRPISFAYHNGYAPTHHTGTVTGAEGRSLKTIDDRPAADVYREWTEGTLIPDTVMERTGILSESTLAPLGRYLESVGDVPYFLLAHPAEVTADGALHLFADVEVGEKLTLMRGSPDHLTQRAGKVAALAVQSRRLDASDIAGALMVYCGGCMLAVRDRLDDVTDGIRGALPGVPFLGIFTFGEQGTVMGGQNRHGNLMISAVVFQK